MAITDQDDVKITTSSDVLNELHEQIEALIKALEMIEYEAGAAIRGKGQAGRIESLEYIAGIARAALDQARGDTK